MIFCIIAIQVLQRSSSFLLSPIPIKYNTINSSNNSSNKYHQIKNLYQTNSNNESSKDVSKTATTTSSILEEANDALTNVGWSIRTPTPINEDGEAMTSDDPFVKYINEGIQKDFGVELNDLLNPAKVVNLERDLYNLRIELGTLTNRIDDIQQQLDDNNFKITTDMVDDDNINSKEIESVRKSIDKKERDLLIERRAVFRTWLKNVFLGQAVLSLGISWIMATNPSALFGGYDWYYSLQLDMPIRVLGFWWWWLFIVPSLRSRRPTGEEKKALDIAFLGTPLVSIIAPVATKDPSYIWIANLLVVAASYGYAFTFDTDDSDGDDGEKQQPAWLKFVYKSLDFGSGRERGARR